MTAVVLAQMSNDGDNTGNGWWWLLGLGWLVFLLAILAVVLVRRFNEPKTPPQQAEDVLAERLARGEIDEDEYRRRRKALRDQSLIRGNRTGRR
jgi:putative membrane protein